MAIKSIPCGGFFYDDETISFEKDEYGRDVISAAAGGGGSDSLVLKLTINEQDEFTTDTTYEEFNADFLENPSRLVVAEIFTDGVPYPINVIDGVEYDYGEGTYSFIQHYHAQDGDSIHIVHAIITFSESGISYNEV